MATDYDAPRRNEADELGEDSLEELKARRAEAQSSSVDVDETDFNENLELPGADLSNEELTVRVLPKQEDEFTCSSFERSAPGSSRFSLKSVSSASTDEDWASARRALSSSSESSPSSSASLRRGAS